MAGNPREHVKDKGFWDRGSGAHSSNDQSAGRAKGTPGTNKPGRTGVRTDLEFPEETKEQGER